MWGILYASPRVRDAIEYVLHATWKALGTLLSLFHMDIADSAESPVAWLYVSL